MRSANYRLKYDMRLMFAQFSLIVIAARRLWNHRLLMGSLLLGLVTAVALLASIPLYTDAAQNRLLRGELTDAGAYRPPFAFLWRYVGAWHGDIELDRYAPINEYLTQQAPAIIGLPLAEETIRYVKTGNMRLFPAPNSGAPNSGAPISGAFAAREPLFWTSVGFITGLEERIQLVEGDGTRIFTDEHGLLPVLISQAMAEQAGLQVGEEYLLVGQNADIPVRIVGVWRPLNPADPFWFYQPRAFDEALLTSEGAFFGILAPQLARPIDTAVWYQIYDGQRVRAADAPRLLERVATAEVRVTALLDNTTLDASPAAALAAYGRAARTLTLNLVFFSVPLIGLIFYFMAQVAGMVVQRSQAEIAILRSRGMSRGQIVFLYLLEGGLLGAIGLLLGMGLGRWLAAMMGRAHSFLDPALLGGGQMEPLLIVLSPTAWRYGLLGVGLVLAALVIPVLSASGHTIVTFKRERARALLAPLWQRYFFDIFLLVFPLYGWYQLRQQGTIALLGGGRDPFANPLLFLTPVLFCFALALLFARFFPWLMRGLAWLAQWLPGATPLLITRQLARSANQYIGPLLLLTLTVSLAIFTASMALTLDSHLHDQVYYQIGADLNLAELGESVAEEESAAGQPSSGSGEGTRWLFLPVSEHLEVDGVLAAARVGEFSGVTNIGGRQQNGRLLGIDRLEFSQVAAFRADFADESLGGLMNRLAVNQANLLVSRDFMNRNALQVGDPLRLTVGTSGEFQPVEFVIAGAVDLFPNHYPQDGPLFVGNLEYIFESLGGMFPYNVWLATDAAVPSEAIISGVRQRGLTVVTAADARQRILQQQNQPERQGLFGLLSVGFLAAAALTVLGFLVYAIVSFQRRFIELGMLRAVGLSVGQMAAFLAGEQALLIVTGMGLGAGLGVWASYIFIPFLQVGEGRAALTPPFIILIAWQQMGLILAIFAAMFVTAVVVLSLLLLRMRLFEAVKLGETA
jgi:putative ABC transport system permease protein